MENIKVFEDKNQLVVFIAERFKELSEKSSSHISLSGGSTPKLLFQFIADSDYINTINWNNLHFWWGDERMVPPEDAESNYGECKKLLLEKAKVPAGNIHRVRGENDHDAELRRLELEMREFFQSDFPVFDLIILGMGADGHTASLFPEGIDLSSKKWLELATHPESGQVRISKTLEVINHAKEVLFMVTGSSKTSTLQEIFSDAEAAQSYPAKYVAPKEGSLLWLLDQDAAKGISLKGENA